MFGRRKSSLAEREHRSADVSFETLEARRLLSSGPSPAAFTTTVQGYTPAEIVKAYGFDQVHLGDGTIAADGAGQTIAIVDAYNHPNISSDLNVFDAEFGLPSANLTVVNQRGDSTLPGTDSGWAGEIALDVEWAHAIAPKAGILLVEADSASVANLMAAVDFARKAAGVSTVSMSWGGSEFFNWGGGESISQTQYDPFFTTPANHQGVTFIAAAGDSGSQEGVLWPASSTRVISVGGTSLFTQDTAGTYGSETGWSGTSGGFSQVEAEPSYQRGVQNTGVRTTPDVSYDADPNTGFAVYDSLAFDGSSGWIEVGGTSAGAPQWAALVALADQARALAGQGTLDGASQTLPALYNLYSAPGTSGYSTYASTFNDVTTGGGSEFHWRWGVGRTGSEATIGYDTVTGLGTPNAKFVVQALAAAGSGSTTVGGSPPSGGGSPGSTAAALPAAPVTASFATLPSESAVAGDAALLKLRITNVSGARFKGPLSITLYASDDGTLSSGDTAVATVSIAQISLRAAGSKAVKLKFNYPADLPGGSYRLIASVTATGTNTAAAQTVPSIPIAIAAPAVDLAAVFAKNVPIVIAPRHKKSVTVRVENLGNVIADGTLSLALYTSTDQVLDAADQLLASLAGHTIKIRPGKSVTLHLRFVAPEGQLGGSYNLLAAITSSIQPADGNATNDIATIATA